MENKRKKGIAPPRYDETFKTGAIRMVTEQGRPSTEVAKELGICIDTLRSWLKAAGVQAGQADRQNRDSCRTRELEAEVLRTAEHWTRIRTNNVMERLNREIRRRTRVIGTFPDGNSALMLVCARLRHVAGTRWGNKKYMNMKHLETALEDAFIAG